MKRIIAVSSAAVVAAFLAACTVPPSSSHVLVGTARTPISPEEVQIYHQPPPAYEEIAILDSSSRNSWAFSDQAKVDIAIQRLKEEAAALGANGVLLRSIDDEYIETTTTTSTVTPDSSGGKQKGNGTSEAGTTGTTGQTGSGTSSKSGSTKPQPSTVYTSSTTSVAADKTASAVAIYVPEGPPSHTEREKQQLAQLKILKELFDEGVISRTEYDARRKKVLAAE